MLRSVLAVIVGYVVIVVIVMLGFAVGFVAPDLAFEPGTVDVRPGWMVYAMAVGFIAAVVGGVVAARIGRRDGPVYALAALLLMAGLVSAAINLLREPPAITAEQLAAMPAPERMQHARQPAWYALALPLLGGAGVLAGGRLCRAPAD
jgi:MFS family permease